MKRYAEWGEPPADGALTGRAATLRRSYRPAGAVSNYVHELRPGEDVALLKRIHANVKIPYPFRGATPRVNLIAVGAGIAPMVQALEKLLETEGDETQVVLMYGNRDVPDILLREKLDAWALAHARASSSSTASARAGPTCTTAPSRRRARRACRRRAAAARGRLRRAARDGARVAAENGWVDQRVIEAHAFPPSRSTLTFVRPARRLRRPLRARKNAPAGSRSGSAPRRRLHAGTEE